MVLFSEDILRYGISSVMGDRYVKSDENKTRINIGASNIYGYSSSQPLPFDEIKFERNVCLEEILKSPDNSENGFF